MVLGDSLVKHLPHQFVDWADVTVRSYRGYHVQDLTALLAYDFKESEWVNVTGVALLIGTNDLKSLSVEAFKLKYKALVQIIRARLGGVNIVLFGFPPRPKDHSNWGWKAIAFNKAIKDIASELRVLHHPLYKACLYKGQPVDRFFLEDGLHLSYEGVKLLAKVVKMYRAEFLK